MQRVLSRRTTFDKALTDFGLKVIELTQKAVDGRPYILVEELQFWMRKISLMQLDNKFVSNTDLLAHAAYSEWGYFSPIEPSRIHDAGDDSCVIVFSILLDLGLGHLINVFALKTILDCNLPVDLSSLKRKLKDLADGERVAEKFNERQWKFRPALFSLAMEKEYFEDRIVPICRKTHINSGGTADVEQIVVQAEFVDRKLRNLLDNDQDASYNDKDYGPCYIFALKTFKEGNFQYYNDEKTAFDGLRGNRGVIRRLGCYSHRVLVPRSPNNTHKNGGRQTADKKDTMNLLLEYGTYDLRLIFGHHTPPVFSKEIFTFWQALFEVADAVDGIHEFKTGGSEFNGWHADIKPENIIYVRGKYKLADPGFARFKKKAQDKCAAPQIRLHGGTDTYGAPEVSSQATVDQTIDTWSLGCVFSMAATWIILGYQGVCQYQLVREKALGTLLKPIEDDGHPLLISQRLTASTKPDKMDCFHNGTNVLREVVSWHALLRSSARKTDPITEAVLDLIDKKMLLQEPNERIKSKQLCEELRQIVSLAKIKNRDALAAETPDARDHREHMEGLLYEIDKEANTQITDDAPPKPTTQPFTPGLPVDRHALKVQMEHVPLKKTSHRYETIPDPWPRSDNPETILEKPTIIISDTTGLKEVLHRPPIRPESSMMSQAEKRKSFRKSTFGQGSRTNTSFTHLTYQGSQLMSPDHASQNVIQARERMDRETKRASMGNVLPRRKPRKDEFLSKHFKNRDIKYLVDDAETMSEHWDEATFLLETLVMKAHGQDPDGPDLTFTNDNAELRKEQDAGAFRKAMHKVRPKKNSQVRTNIKNALSSIFNSYIDMVRRTYNKSLVNALTVIVLTDGLWRGMGDPNDIIPKIEQFDQQLTIDMKGMLRERQVSIQFIQFGEDEEARERLRRLDDDMPFRGVNDMIDFEIFSITGNVFKMLLGSFVEEMDAINDSVEDLSSPDESPPLKAVGSTPTKNLPLPPIEEGLQGPMFGVQAEAGAQETSSRRSKFLSGKYLK